MCGGRGKRLGKLTHEIPKPLIKIGGKTVLELKLRNYLKQGFRTFILSIGYKGDLIRDAVLSWDINGQIRFSDAGERAGILKRLYKARDLFGQRIIMTYGDTYTDLDFNHLAAIHVNNGCEATIVAAPIQNPFGLVELNGDSRVTFFKEKPVLNYYIGYAVIEQTALDFAPPKIVELPDGDGLVTFYKILIAMEKLGAYYHSGLQITFNTERELKDAQQQFIEFYTTRENV